MSAQEYIASGILETYALGAATPAEKQEVEAMLLKFPEVKIALDEIQKVIEDYATAHAVEVDKDLKDWIIESAVSPQEKGKVIALETNSRWKNIAIAASVILIVSIGGNIMLSLKLNKSHLALQEMYQLNQIAIKTSEDASKLYKVTAARLDSAQLDLNILRNPMNQSIAMNSIVEGHPMKAVVHWDMKTMQVAIDPMTLPKTEGNDVYVLWAVIDGKAVNEGGFSLNDSTGIVMMNAIPRAEAFALSLEKSLDVPQHVGPIYVLGATPSTKP